MLTTGDIVQDRYQVRGTLGRGGMAATYLAQDLQRGDEVALKVLTLPPGVSQLRFRRECRVMTRLKHPHVVRIFESGVHDELPFLVMQRIEGGTMMESFAGGATSKEDLARRLEVLIQIASALAYVHAEGIVHRDVKPENVMWDGSSAYLMDFGLAKSDTQGTVVLTELGDLMGTPTFMSPEQARGAPVDARSDLYAFGCLAYWMLAGEPPFVGESFAETILMQMREPAQEPSRINALIPRSVDALVLKLLEKAPNERYSTAHDVVQDLQEAVGTLARSGAAGEAGVDGEQEAEVPRTLLRPRWIGRAESWRTLREALRGLADEEARRLLIQGEPGMGVSRLLRECASEARTQGARVLRVHHDGGVSVPFVGWRDALAELRASDTEAFDTAAKGHEEGLSVLLPEPFGAAKPLDLPADVMRMRLYDAVERVLARLAEERGLVVLVDDLDLADEGSVGMFAHLARRRDTAQVLVVAGLHPEGISDAVEETVQHLQAERIALEPMPDGEVGELVTALLGAPVEAHLGAHVARRAAGNPFFVQEILAGLLEAGAIDRQRGVWRWTREAIAVPESVEAVFDARIERLEQRAQATAAAASAIGDAFDFELLAQVVSVDEDALLDDLDELLRAEILRETHGGDRYAFAHPLLRETLHRRLSTPRRKRLHEKVAAALQEDPDVRPALLADQYLQTSRPERAAPHALAAAREAERVFANDIAETYYRHALTAFPEEDDDRPAALLELAGVLLRTGRWDEAEALFQDAAEIDAVRAEALRGLGELYRRKGDLHASETQLRSAVAVEGASAGVGVDLGTTLAYKGEFADAATVLQEALANALEAGSTDVLVTAQVELGFVEYQQGNWDTALEWYHTARQYLDEEERPLQTAMLAERTGRVHGRKGEWDEAMRHWEEAYRIYGRIGDLPQRTEVLSLVATALMESGELDRAERTLEEARAQAQQLGDDTVVARVAAAQGWVRQLQGRFQEALDLLSSAYEHYSLKGHADAAHALLNIALVQSRLGDADAASVALLGAKRLLDERPQEYHHALASLTEAEIELRGGDAREALPAVRTAIEGLERLESKQEVLDALLLEVEIHMALEQADVAGEVLQRAKRILDEASDPIRGPVVRYLEAHVQHDARSIADARAELEEVGLGYYVELIAGSLPNTAEGGRPAPGAAP